MNRTPLDTVRVTAAALILAVTAHCGSSHDEPLQAAPDGATSPPPAPSDGGDAQADGGGDGGAGQPTVRHAKITVESVLRPATLRSIAVDHYTSNVFVGGDGLLIWRPGIDKEPIGWEAVSHAPSGNFRAVDSTDSQPTCVADTAGIISCSKQWGNFYPMNRSIGPVAWLQTFFALTNGDLGIAIGEDGRVWRLGTSTDTLEQTSAIQFAPVRAATNGLMGTFAVGDQGALARHTDAEHWSIVPSGTTSTLRTVTVMRDIVAWAAGDDGTIVSSPTGDAWHVEPSPTRQVLRASAACGWAPTPLRVIVGDQGTILLAVGNGPFELVPSGTDVALLAVACENDRHFVAVGERGTILRIEP